MPNDGTVPELFVPPTSRLEEREFTFQASLPRDRQQVMTRLSHDLSNPPRGSSTLHIKAKVRVGASEGDGLRDYFRLMPNARCCFRLTRHDGRTRRGRRSSSIFSWPFHHEVKPREHLTPPCGSPDTFKSTHSPPGDASPRCCRPPTAVTNDKSHAQVPNTTRRAQDRAAQADIPTAPSLTVGDLPAPPPFPRPPQGTHLLTPTMLDN